MKYYLELQFSDSPKCRTCMLCRSKGLDLNGETVMGCYGLIKIPKIEDDEPDKLENCPLKCK